MKLLTAQELAEFLNTPTSWVYEAARRRRIPTVRLPGSRYVRFDLAAVQRVLGLKDRDCSSQTETTPNGAVSGEERRSAGGR
jgi:excisionase family DNA binding protein